MKRLLVTGASGNVGLSLIRALSRREHLYQILAGSRNDKASCFSNFDVVLQEFDFEQSKLVEEVLNTVDVLFLLRPPHLSDVKKYFKPLIESAKKSAIQCIIFLSVQGVEKSSMIPHHGIELLIRQSGIPYVFLRPSYFMQNFVGNLHDDLIKDRLIFLPAGRAKFSLVDVIDIGEVAACILLDLPRHYNQAYDITSYDLLDFAQMADILSVEMSTDIRYVSPNVFRFMYRKWRQNLSLGLILVMTMLHFLPRLQEPPQISHVVERITGRKPTSFRQFVRDTFC